MRLGFFASHGGSNMQAILDGIRSGVLAAEPAVLISNNRSSRAQKEGMPFYVLNAVAHPEADALDRAVLAAGETVTGVSIHLVDGEYDQGRILAQAEVPVIDGDTMESLAARVLEREHAFFVETLVALTEGTGMPLLGHSRMLL
jgi:folate-dependent phosphoribosylglycinamide formyltransferase PurN